MLVIWAIVLVIVAVAALLIYSEHEWGFAVGGSTALILVISYYATEFVQRTPLVVLLPEDQRSQLNVMAITAVVLLVLALIAIAYFMGRRSARSKDQ